MYILRLNCEDKLGIVAAVAGALAASDCNIEESAQFFDHLSGQFFMRVVYNPQTPESQEKFIRTFESVQKTYGTNAAITLAEAPLKTLILVSKEDHCLNDILYRWRTSHLNIDIVGVASNHPTCRPQVESRGLAFHHFPITPETKTEQEIKLRTLIDHTGAELIVLARYMQIMSEDFCRDYAGRVINIHHSFLPGFKGAKPYHQAYERGVKIIGATAHFATSDLDEGPIIEQDTMRITHAHTPTKLQTVGRDTEARVLARAIELYSERRIFLHGHRTVIL
ncbi:MAG: formyltetrahydrofolate deformylase [Alphaproteobacteria bacterium]|nr:formyltetrahydrofolate deformylase [Alphaproteobacteria bacterium]MCD8520595.1 formyltetrahydrofolate deformylase [Alphaproteobacteria bacterium]MCD8526212.1 formyltetrahydrofolate deformylase [Alphaproteobacteria bacterium]MCD8571412.1 formyltetrahydrofolate deformylase [Alphaproteobacteria bacterium]